MVRFAHLGLDQWDARRFHHERLDLEGGDRQLDRQAGAAPGPDLDLLQRYAAIREKLCTDGVTAGGHAGQHEAAVVVAERRAAQLDQPDLGAGERIAAGRVEHAAHDRPGRLSVRDRRAQ